MKRISSIAIFVTAAACVASAACNGHGSAATTAEPEAAAPVAVEAPDAPSAAAPASAMVPPPVHHRGLVGMFFRAAEEGELTDDEKAAADKLEEPLRNEVGPRHEMAAFHSDLVASIKAGKMDAPKLQADTAALSKAFTARDDEQVTALAGLHDALTPAQRKAVTDSIRAAQAAHERPAPAADASAAASAAEVAHRLERMKAQLVLDSDQQKQVAALLARETPSSSTAQGRMDAAKKQLEAVLTAFEKDTFDPKKVDLSSTPGKKPTEALDRQVKYIGDLLPILTPGQRDRFAVLMDRGHERGMRGESLAEPPDPSQH
jgi:Spy/CpxP family protein refolding chaperone